MVKDKGVIIVHALDILHIAVPCSNQIEPPPADERAFITTIRDLILDLDSQKIKNDL